MVPAILPEVETAIKTLPNWQSQSTTAGGSIVVRLGLDGIRTVEIIANQSDEDAQLRERLTAARPILELLQAVVRTSR